MTPQVRRTASALTCVAIATAIATGSLGVPLITVVATAYQVSLDAAQWTLTITLLTGAISTPILGRFASGGRHRRLIVVTLALSLMGAVITTLAPTLWLLLVGRSLQGISLGATGLLMAVARNRLGDNANRTIALISVASTAGIGIGYPLAGWLSENAGLSTAYAMGVVILSGAVLAAHFGIPADDPATDRISLDWLGAAVLSVSLVAVLVVVSDGSLWRYSRTLAGLVLGCGIAGLAIWVRLESHRIHPLVDVRALRHPLVALANIIMFISGVAMYAMFTSIARYLQTPTRIGYGHGLSATQAGLALIPFSVLGFVAGRYAPRLIAGLTGSRVLAVASTTVAASCAIFVMTGNLGVIGPIMAMGVLGMGVGLKSAAMADVILSVTPSTETAAAMGVNGVVRSVSFSLGSAVSALILSAFTTSTFPRLGGYTCASTISFGLALAATVLSLFIGRDPAARTVAFSARNR